MSDINDEHLLNGDEDDLDYDLDEKEEALLLNDDLDKESDGLEIEQEDLSEVDTSVTISTDVSKTNRREGKFATERKTITAPTSTALTIPDTLDKVNVDASAIQNYTNNNRRNNVRGRNKNGFIRPTFQNRNNFNRYDSSENNKFPRNRTVHVNPHFSGNSSPWEKQQNNQVIQQPWASSSAFSNLPHPANNQTFIPQGVMQQGPLFGNPQEQMMGTAAMQAPFMARQQTVLPQRSQLPMQGQSGLPMNQLVLPHNPMNVAQNQLGMSQNQLGMSQNQLGMSQNQLGMSQNTMGFSMNQPGGLVQNQVGFPPNQRCLPQGQGSHLPISQNSVVMSQGPPPMNPMNPFHHQQQQPFMVQQNMENGQQMMPVMGGRGVGGYQNQYLGAVQDFQQPHFTHAHSDHQTQPFQQQPDIANIQATPWENLHETPQQPRAFSNYQIQIDNSVQTIPVHQRLGAPRRLVLPQGNEHSGNNHLNSYDQNVQHIMNKEPQHQGVTNNSDITENRQFNQNRKRLFNNNWKNTGDKKQKFNYYQQQQEQHSQLNIEIEPSARSQPQLHSHQVAPNEEEDEETKQYRLKIEEQKRKREEILRQKEERRKLAAAKEAEIAAVAQAHPNHNITVIPTQPELTVNPNPIYPPVQVTNQNNRVINRGNPQPRFAQNRNYNMNSVNQGNRFNFNGNNSINNNVSRGMTMQGRRGQLRQSYNLSTVRADNVKVLVSNDIPLNSMRTLHTIQPEPMLKEPERIVTVKNKPGGGGLSGTLPPLAGDRIVVPKLPSLLDTNCVLVKNLATGTRIATLHSMCKRVGGAQKLQLDKQERQATIQFKSVAAAHSFFKKYQRHMLDLSMIEVVLHPMT